VNASVVFHFVRQRRAGHQLNAVSYVVVPVIGDICSCGISKAGEDDRFDEIKPDFVRFLITWTIQGLWVVPTEALAR
jgi:hypothetical protein